MHTFYKLYRKEQCTLERYNAQLCLRLTVDDPARITREVFNANLTKIDPAAQAVRNIAPPAGKVSLNFATPSTPQSGRAPSPHRRQS